MVKLVYIFTAVPKERLSAETTYSISLKIGTLVPHIKLMICVIFFGDDVTNKMADNIMNVYVCYAPQPKVLHGYF